MIVEDDESLVELMGHFMVRSGFNCIASTTATKALEILSEESVHVIVTDIVMPGMNGVEFVRQVRERRPKVPVVVAMAFQTKHLEEVLAADAELYKPFHSAELVAMVDWILAPNPSFQFIAVSCKTHYHVPHIIWRYFFLGD